MDKKIFRTNIVPAGRNLSLSDLRHLAMKEPENFVRKMQEGAESGKLRLQDIRDIKGLFMALGDVQVPVVLELGGVKRTVSATAFPILTGTLAIAAINEAYARVPSIGQELVTEIEDNKKITTIAAVATSDKNVDEVKELEDLPEIGTDESKVEIRHKRNGRKLTISAEAIEENEIADIVSRINALGEIAADWVEEQTLERICDYYGSRNTPIEPYVYRPNGTGTALYRATANTPGTRAPSGTRVNNNAFVDDTDLDAARAVLMAMKNDRGKRISIPWSEVSLLVPDGILGKVLKVVNSEYVPGVENEVSNWGPRGQFRTRSILSSPKLDDISTSTWYLGAFKRQFLRKWKLRFEYVTLGMDTQAYLNSRVAFQARIAWDCEVGSRDYVFAVQNLAATTAPGD